MEANSNPGKKKKKRMFYSVLAALEAPCRSPASFNKVKAAGRSPPGAVSQTYLSMEGLRACCAVGVT